MYSRILVGLDGSKPALDAARLVIPVELVTDPFDPAHLSRFDAALATLRQAGAVGTKASPVHGFGVHLNVETASPEGAGVARVATAFALLEPLLREVIDLDLSRRLLPFIEPFPRPLVTALADQPDRSLDALATTVLAHSTSRNHGLDLLPILAHGAADVVAAHVDPDPKIAPRPAYHYRLPESRIDAPDWGVTQDWELWCRIEDVAADDATLDALARAWRDWDAGVHLGRASWAEQSRGILADHGLEKDIA